MLLSIVVAPIYIPTVHEGVLFSTLYPEYIICRLFNDGHSDWCEVETYHSFDFHLSNN